MRHFIAALERAPGVEHVAFFGAALHVSGRERGALERALLAYRGQANIVIEEAAPSLEDVFIDLQEQK